MILRQLWRAASLAALLNPFTACAIDIDLTNTDSIKAAASTKAFDMMSSYIYNQSGQIPGKLNDTWWEGGAIFMTLMQYWHFTGDESYTPTVMQGMLHQAGEDANYMPSNYSSFLGNDDQVFWGLAAMTAAEVKYPDPPAGQPSWLGLAQAVFNTQATRWDTGQCGGGLHWQITPVQAGFNTKNSVSNGGFFQIAARLALYTGNSSYADWADRIWKWSTSVPLLNDETWQVDDTTSTTNNCSDGGTQQWTYNYAIYMMGAAYMYNYTNGSDTWLPRVNGLLDKSISQFFPSKYGGDVMSEVTCEPSLKCDRNQACFKGFMSAWFAFTTYLVPETSGKIMPLLSASATAAAKQCSGGANGRTCGLRWWQPEWDHSAGMEQEMSVLAVFTHNLVGKTGGPPVSANTGGTSKGNPGQAGDGGKDPGKEHLAPITTGDRAGAGILTLLVLAAVLGGGAWIII